MIKIEIKDGRCEITSNGSSKDLSIETVVIVQTLARNFSKLHGLSANDAVDVISDAAKHLMGEFKKYANDSTTIEIGIPRKKHGE